MKTFKGEIALVTGAGSGIGKELALALGREGAKVVVTDMNRKRLDETVAELKGMGAEALGYKVDHSNITDVEELRDKVFEDLGRVDVMCLNAGVGHGARIEEMTIDDWQWLMSINLWGAIYMVQLFVPRMIEKKKGRILITSSGLGLIACPGMAPYSTSKFAMVGLAESLRMELYMHNIRVSVLCPGIIKTNIVADGRIRVLDQGTGENVQQKVSDFYDRFGTLPDVVARAGLKALEKDIAVMPTPFHVWPAYLLHRFSPALYQAIGRQVWKRGWLF